jgi:hypothetical protein
VLAKAKDGYQSCFLPGRRRLIVADTVDGPLLTIRTVEGSSPRQTWRALDGSSIDVVQRLEP